jgi:hypothetical protein
MNTYPNTFAFVQIHLTTGAGGDIYGTTWGNARATFYTDFAGFPTSYFDGHVKREGAYPYATYQADYLALHAVNTDVTIQLQGMHLTGQTYRITATVCVEAGGGSRTMRIYIAQVLDYWPATPTYHRNGFKQAGATQDVTLAGGQCQNVVRDFTFDTDSWNNKTNIRIIAWAQEPQATSPPADRALVYQAAILNWPFMSDCNENGIDDPCDISCAPPGCNVTGCGQSDDCDGNGVPDDCQADCNNNGVADVCDISSGYSEDCQPDGIPDECQMANNDCNNNGIPDDCDIASGFSDDCDDNAVPDECQPDCNNNGVADYCDIADGTSEDCQPDGIPDDCQLAGNDCNGNSIPDDCDIDVPHPASITFNLSSNPGWSVQGGTYGWAFGTPTGGGTHNHDPTGGHTGSYVYGYNLSGDYGSNLTVKYLTTTAIDCTGMYAVELSFWRWLGVEAYTPGPPAYGDRATVEVSNNGTSWTTVWANPSSNIADTSWTKVSYSIASVASNKPTVYIRWGMGPTDGSTTYPGWNIDDVELRGNTYTSKDCNSNVIPDECEGGFANLAVFVSQLLADSPNPSLLCIFDMDGNGVLNGKDIQPFIESIL